MAYLESEAKKLYRMADKIEEVNWSAGYASDIDLTMRILPDIYDFTERAIQTVTCNDNALRAVLGLSGGIDSCVCSYVVAETMKNAIQKNDVHDADIVLLNWNARSDEDTNYSRQCFQQLKYRYPQIKIQYAEQDLNPLLRNMGKMTDTLLNAMRHKKIYPGELATRVIDCMALEYADKTGHCVIDSTNKSEIILGEIVIGAGGEVALLANLFKSQVYDIAEALDIPESIIRRKPINSTFGTDKIAGYFGEIPSDFSPRDIYRVLDLALLLLYDKKYSPERLAQELGHSKTFTQKLSRRIENQNHRRAIPCFSIYEMDEFST